MTSHTSYTFFEIIWENEFLSFLFVLSLVEFINHHCDPIIPPGIMTWTHYILHNLRMFSQKFKLLLTNRFCVKYFKIYCMSTIAMFKVNNLMFVTLPPRFDHLFVYIKCGCLQTSFIYSVQFLKRCFHARVSFWG